LITVFGATTAPLLLCLVLDIAAGLLVIRSYMEMRAGLCLAIAVVAKTGYWEGA
jgi:hypothetical protein